MGVVLRKGFLVLCLALAALAARAGEVRLDAGQLDRIGPGLWAATGLQLPPPDPEEPLIGPENTLDGARLLRHLSAAGTLNGFEGVLYDNRDRGHSSLDPALFPRLTRLVYGKDLIDQSLDYGLAGAVVLPAVVFGNSSTAITTGPFPRSQTRLGMTAPGRPEAIARLYAANHLYMYPEHRDHDGADLFPANWPYTITSQGSSGSDRPFLAAVAMTLAAFPRDTMTAMRDRGLVVPTVQMILRRNLAGVTGREAYLSGMAHPVVFDGTRLRPGRMAAQAAELQADAIPPLVRLSVLDESFGSAEGLAGLNERLFDTDQAVARIWRGVGSSREIVLSTAGTADPNGRPLSFEWRLLTGDPAKVRITPSPDGTTARISVDWHDPVAVPTREGDKPGERMVSRVDVGVFANNGVHDSAPAILSVAFPAHQRRTYAPGPDGRVRLVSVDYDAAGRKTYYDPVLFWSAPWTDVARRDADGTLTGWDRHWTDGRTETVPAAPAPDYRIDRTDPRHPRLTAAPE